MGESPAYLSALAIGLPTGRAWRFDAPMPDDPFVREKFTRERTAAKKLAAEISSASEGPLPTAVESWRELQSQNISNSPEAAARADREGDGDR